MPTLANVRALREAIAQRRPVYATKHDDDFTILPVTDARMDAHGLHLLTPLGWRHVADRSRVRIWSETVGQQAVAVMRLCLCDDCLARYRQVRIIFTCRACGSTAAQSYYSVLREGREYRFRLDERGFVQPGLDCKCPQCGHKRHMKDLKARYSAEVKCDARCWGARGHECVCSCGGANHGSGHPLAS